MKYDKPQADGTFAPGEAIVDCAVYREMGEFRMLYSRKFEEPESELRWLAPLADATSESMGKEHLQAHHFVASLVGIYAVPTAMAAQYPNLFPGAPDRTVVSAGVMAAAQQKHGMFVNVKRKADSAARTDTCGNVLLEPTPRNDGVQPLAASERSQWTTSVRRFLAQRFADHTSILSSVFREATQRRTTLRMHTTQPRRCPHNRMHTSNNFSLSVHDSLNVTYLCLGSACRQHGWIHVGQLEDRAGSECEPPPAAPTDDLVLAIEERSQVDNGSAELPHQRSREMASEEEKEI
jgi:hypothetical protein